MTMIPTVGQVFKIVLRLCRVIRTVHRVMHNQHCSVICKSLPQLLYWMVFQDLEKKKSEKVTEKNQHEFEVDTVLKKNSFQHLRAEFAAICNSACWDNEFKKSLAIYGQIQR